MKNKILYSRFLKVLLRCFFSLFYDKKYLKGYFFDQKRLGWYWCFRSLPNRLCGDNRNVKFPVHPRTIVSNSQNIEFDIDNLNLFQTPGCYWQAHYAKIIIGAGSYVAPNVGLISANHNVHNINMHDEGKDIIIGKNSWIGMNAVILPGVILGDHTIVAAGAVVTKSFPDGNVIIGGVPAKIIKSI